MARPADPHRRETILRAATEVFIERGFSDARLTDIAQRASVVTSTLYLYFRSKEEMVSAIAQENRQILLDRLEPVLAHLRTEEDLAQFVEIVLAHARERRDEIIIISLESGLSTPRAELAMEMLIMMTFWIISHSLMITEEEEEPFKHFCVQWLSRALLPARGDTGPEAASP